MAGRPKKSFSIEEVTRMEQLAYEGCQNGTIANITGTAINTLVRHFGRLLTKKRCERKQWLRKCQNDLSKTNPAMAIFLGKNELDQVDKRVIEAEVTEQQRLTEAETAEAQRISNILNLEQARKGKAG